jgi:TolB-like protein
VIPDLKKLSAEFTSPSVAVSKKGWLNRYVVPIAVIVLVGMFGLWYWQSRPETVGDEVISLVVLPFENLGAEEDEYFADGMTDEITARLASLSGLRVISRTSAVYYKGSEKSLRDIAQELNVDYVLEGTIRWDKSGDTDRVRIIPQLIRASDDSHIWASTFERALTQVFSVQADIAEQVATALDVNLLGDDRRKLQQIPTNNIEAYDYYLRGQELFHSFRDRRDVEMAVVLFEKALALDTAFVSAYSELAMTHARIYWYGYDRTDERSTNAKLAAERAMALDSNNASARTALGYYYYYLEHDFGRALSEFEHASRINTNDADILTVIGLIKRREGKWEESYQLQERALELNPFSYTRGTLVETARFMRRFEDAERIATKGLELFPDDLRYCCWLGNILVARDGDVLRAIRLLNLHATGRMRNKDYEVFWRWWYFYLQRRYEKALESMLDSVNYCQRAEDTADYLFSVAETYHLLNRTAESRIYYDSARVYIEALDARDMVLGGFLPPSLGLIYSRLGEDEMAVQAARRDSARVPISEDAYLGTKPLTELAVTYARVGEPEKALYLIDTLLSIPSELTVAILKLDPVWDPLRNHPRFRALIKKYEQERGISRRQDANSHRADQGHGGVTLPDSQEGRCLNSGYLIIFQRLPLDVK